MSAEGDSQPASSVPGRDSTECKPLLEAATRELFQGNAFRITGLSVDATAREIARREDKLKRLEGLERLGIANQDEKLKVMEQMGLKGSGYTSAFPLKVPPTVDQIRGAFQKLNKSPDRRLVDEFFWFWPAEFGKAASDPAIQALVGGDVKTVEQIWAAAESGKNESVVAKHNLAVLWHLKALDLENDRIGGGVDASRRREIEETWRNALKRWEALSTDDALWEKVASRIRQIDDARLTTGFGRRIRSTLRPALNKINAELALAYAKAGNMDLATAHVQLMRETGQSSDDVAKAGELVLAPVVSRVREQIKRAKQQAETNPETADQAARDLITGALRFAGLFDLFFGEAEHPAKDVLEEVASTTVDCLVAYVQKTGGTKTSIELHELALELAKTDKLRDLIKSNIEIGRSRLQRELLHELLNAIRESTAAPSARLQRFRGEAIQLLLTATASLDSNPEIRNGLMDDAAIVLNNIAVDAWNKFKDKKTAIAAIELAIQYACDPALKQKANENRDIFQHKRPGSKSGGQKSSESLPIGCWIWIAIFVVFSIVNSCHPRRDSSSNTPYRPSDTAIVSIHHRPSISGASNPASKTNDPLSTNVSG
jgi:hypothetical protein